MGYDNGALVRRFFDEVWNKGNLGAMGELLSADHIAHDPIAGDMRGIELERAQVLGYRNAFPDLRFILDDVLVSGEKVAVRWSVTGTHDGEIMGVPPTGKTHSLTGITISRISNGKIVESWVEWNTLQFAQNLGIAPRLEPKAPPPVRPEARPH
jgi:steroid delta-isomerase-like uncharacterized protein